MIRQLTATGFYSDGSQADLTDDVQWTTTAGTIVSVSATGLATGLAYGSDAIMITDLASDLRAAETFSVTSNVHPRLTGAPSFDTPTMAPNTQAPASHAPPPSNTPPTMV